MFALYFSLRCSIFNDRLASAFSRRPRYYITSKTSCQYLFQKFFNFFLSFFQSLSGATALVFYHFIPYLSRGFLKFLHFCTLLYILWQIRVYFTSFSTARADHSLQSAAPITVPNCEFSGIIKFTSNISPSFKNVSVIGLIAVRFPVKIIFFNL